VDGISPEQAQAVESWAGRATDRGHGGQVQVRRDVAEDRATGTGRDGLGLEFEAHVTSNSGVEDNPAARALPRITLSSAIPSRPKAGAVDRRAR
jgi:hypothetical protein